MNKSGFLVSTGKNVNGFKLKFDNGYTISVIFGDNTTSNDVEITKDQHKTEFFSKTAEIAVISPNGSIIPFHNSDIVRDNSEPKHLPQIISWVMNR